MVEATRGLLTVSKALVGVVEATIGLLTVKSRLISQIIRKLV